MATRRGRGGRGLSAPPSLSQIEQERAFAHSQARQRLELDSGLDDLSSDEIEELAELRGDAGVHVLILSITLKYDDRKPETKNIAIAGRGDDLLSRVTHYTDVGHVIHEIEKYKTVRDDWPDDQEGWARPSWDGEVWSTLGGGFVEGEGKRRLPYGKVGRKPKKRAPYETQDEKARRLARQRKKKEREIRFQDELADLPLREQKARAKERRKRRENARKKKK